MTSRRQETRFPAPPGPFPTTCWTVIRAGQDRDSPRYQASLETLYRRYWGPVYLHIRRHWSADVEDAKDLTQAFFVSFLEGDLLRSVDADRGRFRSFVCAALRHFLLNQKRAAAAGRRRPPGGLLSLDALAGDDSRFDVPDGSSADADEAFRQDWKRAVLETALEDLRAQARARGREVAVDLLVRYDLDRKPGERLTYQDLARDTGLTVHQVTNGLHWARQELRAAVRRELREQVASPEDLQAEARELFGLEP